MKKVLLMTILCLCVMSIPVEGVFFSTLSDNTLHPNEETDNLRSVYETEGQTRYMKYLTRIWKLNPIQGEEWYVVSGQVDAKNDKIRAESVAIEIFIWNKDPENFPLLYYEPEWYDAHYLDERGYVSRSTYEPIISPYPDVNGKEQWVEDIKVGILREEKEYHWGWFGDEDRFTHVDWELTKGQAQIFQYTADYWLWKDTKRVQQQMIMNFECVLLVGGHGLNFIVRYVFQDAGGVEVHEARQHYISNSAYRLDEK